MYPIPILLIETTDKMKRILLIVTAILTAFSVEAQVNVQLHYDFGRHLYTRTHDNRADLSAQTDENGDHIKGSGRMYLTATTEMFKPDKFGSTFFFIDLDFNDRMNGAYWEIARELCFWNQSKANWLSIHLEYNGGFNAYGPSYDGFTYPGTKYNDAWLLGLTYSGHSADFSKTWSISAMYKLIPNTMNMDGKKDIHNFQITGVWGVNFAKGKSGNYWCTFSGYFDFWRQWRPWQIHAYKNPTDFKQGTQFIFMGEPQFWVNFNAIECFAKNDVNLSIGTEVEISNNFIGTGGFYAIPTLGIKWTF